MALSSTGKITFKVRLSTSAGVTYTYTVTVPEGVNCDVVARTNAITQSALGASAFTAAELWIVALDSA